MRCYRVPGTRDVLADVPFTDGEILGDGVAIIRPGDERHAELERWATEDAPLEEYPLIRRLYAERALRSPV